MTIIIIIIIAILKTALLATKTGNKNNIENI